MLAAEGSSKGKKENHRRKVDEQRGKMMDTFQQDEQQETGIWETGLCTTAYCQHSFLSVQQCPNTTNLWRVALHSGEEGWLVAAIAPICPGCGGNLLNLNTLRHWRGADTEEMKI
jgi:hypothetical protein